MPSPKCDKEVKLETKENIDGRVNTNPQKRKNTNRIENLALKQIVN